MQLYFYLNSHHNCQLIVSSTLISSAYQLLAS